jgi:hypothetical protein
MLSPMPFFPPPPTDAGQGLGKAVMEDGNCSAKKKSHGLLCGGLRDLCDGEAVSGLDLLVSRFYRACR